MKAIMKVPRTISQIVSIRAFLRPCRSAYDPISRPLIGRIRYVTPNTAYASTSWTPGLSAGKNVRPM